MLKNNDSKIDTELFSRLKEIYDDDDFIVSVFAYAENDALKKKLINFIDKNPGITDKEIILYSLSMSGNN